MPKNDRLLLKLKFRFILFVLLILFIVIGDFAAEELDGSATRLLSNIAERDARDMDVGLGDNANALAGGDRLVPD